MSFKENSNSLLGKTIKIIGNNCFICRISNLFPEGKGIIEEYAFILIDKVRIITLLVFY